jgi:glycosidase
MAQARPAAVPLPISRAAAERVGRADLLAVRDIRGARRLSQRLRSAGIELAAGELFAFAVLNEILGRIIELYRRRVDPSASAEAVAALERSLGPDEAARIFEMYHATFVGAPDEPTEAIEGLALVWLANANPALESFAPLIDDRPLASETAYDRLPSSLAAHFETRPRFGPDNQPLPTMLRSPALAVPDSLAGQLEYVRERWGPLLEALGLGDLLQRLVLGLDVLDEEALDVWRRTHPGGPGNGRGPGASAIGAAIGGLGAEPERFSADSAWMPRVVLMAKSSYVWLDQLGRRYQREVSRLDQVPDEALDELARWGVSGLWLIGLWQRSRASERIKRVRGNPEAVASAYSLDDYRIADDLGGEWAYANLRDRAWARGIRLASDMVPNHMGIDSRWLMEHPERFLALSEPPYPGYSFSGENLSDDGRAEVRIEDHYWDNSDAAVVFERRDTTTGERRYVYHGNDGTSFPWNDTAQLNYLDPATREAVIQAILDVAKRFPIIRFDAAMTLARRHIRRLWFPEPGAGGSIPSRAEHAVPAAEFDRLMPTEFWRDVVDRVAAEVPDTLLLAEAFWLMEGYFVRTLGMHRVYNSAFMHMLRDEDNAGYRRVMKDTLEFDPEILKRYVNFMSNPDEKTAVEQFGKGDKYFGVATVLATLPGLPMLGHGQVEGYAEKYGMEYRRAYRDESPDLGLVAYHERALFPLLHRRAEFAEVRDFLLYDVVGDDGEVLEDVFAYSNVGPGGERSLVVYHNRFASVSGWVRQSAAYSVPAGGNGQRHQVRRSLGDGWRLPSGDDSFVTWREAVSGLEFVRAARSVREHGLRVQLGAYERRVLLDVRDIRDGSAGIWRRLADGLGGRGVRSLDVAMQELALEPVHAPLRELIGGPLGALIRQGRSPNEPETNRLLDRLAATVKDATGVTGNASPFTEAVARRLARIADLSTAGRARDHDKPPDRRDRRPSTDPLSPVHSAFADAWHRAVLVGWAVLEPLGRLAPGVMAGPTSRAWYDELRLQPVVAGALRSAGIDEAGAWSASDRIRTLVALPRPGNVGGRSVSDSARRLVAAWLDHPDVRPFIRVNHWEGVDYFGRDEWRELLDWALLLDGIDEAEEKARDRSGAVIRALVDLGERSGYRLDGLQARKTQSRTERRTVTSKGASRPR